MWERVISWPKGTSCSSRLFHTTNVFGVGIYRPAITKVHFMVSPVALLTCAWIVTLASHNSLQAVATAFSSLLFAFWRSGANAVMARAQLTSGNTPKRLLWES